MKMIPIDRMPSTPATVKVDARKQHCWTAYIRRDPGDERSQTPTDSCGEPHNDDDVHH